MTLPLLIAVLAGFVASGAVYILWTFAERHGVKGESPAPPAEEPPKPKTS